MKEAEAKKIAANFAADVGLSPRRGGVFIQVRENGEFQLLVSADPGWLAAHPLPHTFGGLVVVPSDRIIGEAQRNRVPA